MLELFGFLTAMAIWWGSCFVFLICVTSPLVMKYLEDIGANKLKDLYYHRVLGLLLKTQVSKNNYSNYNHIYKLLFVIVGAGATLLSLLGYYGNRSPYREHIWDFSIFVSETFAPYVWVIIPLIAYPVLVKLGKFTIAANTLVKKLDK